MGNENRHRLRALTVFLVYLAFVVYGSLVPLELRAMDWDQALERFLNIRYLELGVASRADWIANGVLYLPLAFLGCLALLGMRRVGWTAWPAVLLVAMFCSAVAVAVEFAQLWFAPRTVSINDLIAEGIGIGIGILLWIFARQHLASFRDAFRAGGRKSILAVFVLYGLVYLAFSLFPFDFLVSRAELAWKLQSDHLGWLVAPSCGNAVRCTARMGMDVLATLPFGLLAVLLIGRTDYRLLFLAGALAGLILESAQLLLASGVSQGLSVPLRGVGLVLGGALGHLILQVGTRPVARLATRAALALALPYLIGLTLVTGWFSAPAVGLDAALARFGEIRWLPFNYHYFTSEAVAMASTLAHLVLYAPLGVHAWSRGAARAAPDLRAGMRLAMFSALAIAGFIEGGKLFFPPKHPDPTNLWIAMAGALLAFAVARWLERVIDSARQPATAPASTPQTPAETGSPEPIIDAHPQQPPFPAPSPFGTGLAVLALLALLIGMTTFPVARPILGLALLLYAVLLWYRPMAWLAVIPALLALLDPSPITGRLYLDAFDLFVLTTLAVGHARFSGRPLTPWSHRLFPLAWILLWISWSLAMARGLWPLTEMGWPPAETSHSPMEAWMVGKGLLWALLLLPLLRRLPAALWPQARRLLMYGLIAGLAGVALLVLWERHVFVGILDFRNVFRVTGPFASMHTGGAYIEAFLAFALPFLAVATIQARNGWLRLAGILLVALASYAMMVTFSRAGWGGLLAGLLVAGVGMLRGRVGIGRRAMAAGLSLVILATALPVLLGGFAQSRLALVLEDLQARQEHWGNAVSLMQPGVVSLLFGEGFGHYPSAYLAALDYSEPPGSFAVLAEDGRGYLRLGAGTPTYLDQRVPVQPNQQYQLTLRLRHSGDAPRLRVALCEKALLYSFQCLWLDPKYREVDGGWSEATYRLDSAGLGALGHWPYPPVVLTLYNAGRDGTIDLDEVSLRTAEDRELLANGDFSRGARHWLFVTDHRLAWHIDQQWIEQYFAQGLLGVGAFALLLTAAGLALWPAFRATDPFAVALAAGLLGFLTVGLLGSTLDTARLSLLVYLGALAAGSLVSPAATPRSPA
jgi:VanZ family protein